MANKFADGKPIQITLGPDIKFAWPYVFEKYVDDDGKDDYRTTILIPYSNKKAIALFEDAIDAALDRGYSGKLKPEQTFKKNVKEADLLIPLKDGADAEGDYADVFKGYMYAKVKTSRRPQVVDENCQQILDPEEFYSGVVGAVSITVAPYNNKSQGVGAYLNHVMKLGDGERIGGGNVSPETAFAEFRGQGGAARPARGEGRSRGRGSEDDYQPRAAMRSRSRDTEEDDRRPARGESRSRRRESEGSDDPMFD